MPEISFFYAPYICIEKYGNDKAIAVGGIKLSVSEAGGDSGCQLADEGGASPLRRSPPQVS